MYVSARLPLQLAFQGQDLAVDARSLATFQLLSQICSLLYTRLSCFQTLCSPSADGQATWPSPSHARSGTMMMLLR